MERSKIKEYPGRAKEGAKRADVAEEKEEESRLRGAVESTSSRKETSSYFFPSLEHIENEGRKGDL